MVDLRLANPGHTAEFLIYSDASNDGTNDILREYAADVDVTFGTERRGKSTGMNTLLTKACGEIVLFTDANVILDRNVLNALDDCFRDPTVGVACGHLQYVLSENVTAEVGANYWRFEEFLKQLETDTGSTPGADGSIFAIRRHLFEPVPADIIDDFYTSMQILCGGHRVVRCAGAIAYEKSVDSVGQEGRRKTRIACRAYNCHKLLRPRRRRLSTLDRYKYLSHKWIRWMTFSWLMLALVFATLAVTLHSGLVTGGLCIAAVLVGVAVLYAGNACRLPLLTRLCVVLVSLFATQLGIWQSQQGKKYQTWNPPASARTMPDGLLPPTTSN